MDFGRKILRNVFFVWLGYGSQIVITFLLTPLMIRQLGNEGYGFWILLQSLTGYYGLIDMGLRAGVTQTVTQRIASKDTNSLLEYFNGIYPLILRVVASILILGLLAGIALSYALPIDEKFSGLVFPLVFIQSIGIACTIGFFPFTAVLPGLQRYDLSESIAVLSRVITACLCWSAITLYPSLLVVSLVYLVMNFVDSIVRTFCSLTLIPELWGVRPKHDRNQLKQLYRVGGWNFVAQTSHQMLHRFNAILVGFLFSVSSIVPFNVASSLAEHSNRIISISSRVLFPIFAHLEHDDNVGMSRVLFVLSSKISLGFSLAIAFAGWVWIADFLSIWLAGVEDLGNVILNARSLFVVFALINVFMAIRGIGGQLLMGKDQVEFMAKTMLFESILAIGLSLLYSLNLGVVGIPMGNLTAFTISTFFISIPRCGDLVGLSFWASIRSIFLRPLIYLASSAFLLTCWVSVSQRPTTFFHFIVIAVIPTVAIAVLCVPILLNASELRSLLRLVRVR